jgi:hypothetical protein
MKITQKKKKEIEKEYKINVLIFRDTWYDF